MATLQVNFYSKALRREVTFNALVPLDDFEFPGMPKAEKKPLKAIYLLNGYSGSHSDWISFSRIRELSDKHRIAVFMPAGENHFYVDDVDKGSLYGEYVGKELVEFTRKMFPLSDQREDTFIGGLSMGGYGAIRNGFKYAEHFSRIIALSSAIITYKIANASSDYTDCIADYKYFTRVFGDLDQLQGSDKDPEALVLGLKEKKSAIPATYMACGTEDFLLDVNQRFHDFLVSEQVEHRYVESQGGHTWDFWNEYIEKALLWAIQ
ncbi:alpha/beta hydrolase-fold protein [Paenibacillus alginolyticus]|uniref:alpha/beta hydrolase n=1 Tax=Paenibacillus alginolyticus TaxID=59839 RepID=UPI00041BBFA8|nr:alpha/beta hydrolase-fold protein [Paenibacillus alginolyticus]MCY9663461.1 alpha/beta hydrolase-fold protein [Paenibacillus alginolyticus]